MIRTEIVALIIFLLFSSCNRKKAERSLNVFQANISGYLANGANSPILIQKIKADQFQTLDSIYLNEKSEFEVVIPVENPDFYALRNAAGNYITIFCKGNDSIRIESDYTDMRHFKLQGSYEVKEIERLNDATQSFLGEIAIYAAIIRDSAGSPNYPEIKLETDRKYREAFRELRTFSEDFIYRNDTSLISLLALSNEVGPGFFIFHPIKDREIFLHVDSILMLRYSHSDAVNKIHEQLQKLNYEKKLSKAELSAGEKAPDFSLPGPHKEVVRLSDLSGKIVLLNFWASWSKPSRDMNAELKKIYSKYHFRGLEILQLSLDKNYEDWILAINEDKLSWLHGSELKFWDSEIAAKFGIKTLPTSFLIGKDGMIICRCSDSSELNEKLSALITQ